MSKIDSLYAQALSTHLVSLYRTNTITDISIKCGDEDFDLHSPVLSHGSNYFRTILSTQVEPQINLDFEPPIQAPTFRIIVDSLYTGVVNDIAEENVTDILEGSHHLQVKHATDACVNFMIRHLDTENCLQYWLSARLCDNKKVKDAAIGLIGRHLDLVSKTPLFLALEADVVVEILSDDELQVPSEVHAYESAMGWLKYDSEGRRKHLSDVLNSIRLDLLPVNYLVNVVGKEDMIEENSSAMSKYSGALKCKLGGVKTNVKSRHNVMHRMRGDYEKMSKSMRLSSTKGQPNKDALVIVNDDPSDSAHQLIANQNREVFLPYEKESCPNVRGLFAKCCALGEGGGKVNSVKEKVDDFSSSIKVAASRVSGKINDSLKKAGDSSLLKDRDYDFSSSIKVAASRVSGKINDSLKKAGDSSLLKDRDFLSKRKTKSFLQNVSPKGAKGESEADAEVEGLETDPKNEENDNIVHVAVPLSGGKLQDVKEGENEDDDMSHSNHTDMDGLSIATPQSNDEMSYA